MPRNSPHARKALNAFKRQRQYGLAIYMVATLSLALYVFLH